MDKNYAGARVLLETLDSSWELFSASEIVRLENLIVGMIKPRNRSRAIPLVDRVVEHIRALKVQNPERKLFKIAAVKFVKEETKKTLAQSEEWVEKNLSESFLRP